MDSLPFHLLEEILVKLDPKSLAKMQCADKSINSHVSNDPYFNSSVKGSIPKRYCDSSPEFTPALSSAMDVDEKVVEVKKVAHDDKCIFNLSMIMRVVGKISSYAQKLVKEKETLLGKRLLIEDKTTLKMDVSFSSYKLMNVERINKRRRFTDKYISCEEHMISM